MFNPYSDMKNVKLFVGLTFPNATVLREAVRKYGLDNQIDTKFAKNEGKRFHVKCANSVNCPWRIWASKKRTEETFVITVMSTKHECGKATKCRQLSSKYIAKLYLSRIIANPTWKIKDMAAEIGARFQVQVPIGVCGRAKRRALIEATGSMQEHYGKLWDYRKELKKTNPGSTIKIDYVEHDTIGRIFQRIYICFKALKDGFKAGCRKFIGVDGCFLKGIYKGHLLVAIGRDANNQMFPVAWAVVQVENNENWSWFFSHLIEDLDMYQGLDWTVMSDKMKGIIFAVNTLLPFAEHRACARHVYANWKENFKGNEYKILFWNIARASNKMSYRRACDELKEVDENAYYDLMNRDVERWCKAFFNTTVKCDSCENNMVEAFNGSIRDARAKPLIHLLEDLRKRTMVRMQKRRDWMKSFWDDIGPRIRNTLDAMNGDVRLWTATFNGIDKYEVSLHKEGYVVCLPNRDCTCREWNLTGVPCIHGLCCIYRLGHNVIDYVDDSYKKVSFLKTYEHALNPVGGENNWERSSKVPLCPPVYTKKPGRMQTKRRKSAHESPKKKKRHSDVKDLGRRGIEMHCRVCGEEGHNRRTCKKKIDSRDVSGSTSRDHLVGPSNEGGVATVTSRNGSCTSNMGPATNKKISQKSRNLGKKKVAETDGVRRGRGRPPKHVSKVQMKGYEGTSSMETIQLEQRVNFAEMNQSLTPIPTTLTIPLPDQTDWINKLQGVSIQRGKKNEARSPVKTVGGLVFMRPNKNFITLSDLTRLKDGSY